MSTRKSMTFPIIIALIFIIITISLFASIKQTEVICSNSTSFDSGIKLDEKVVAEIDGKKISRLQVTKTIYLSDKYKNEDSISKIKDSLDRTLSYLGDNVKYNVSDDKIIVTIDVNKNEIVLLDNIDFSLKNNAFIHIDSNTKSSDVITLKVGDSYSDGEFMQKMKSMGYSCK